MIVKVQISQYPKDAEVLVYDQGKRHVYQGPSTEHVKSLLMGRPKAYFYAELVGTEFAIGDEVPAQEW